MYRLMSAVDISELLIELVVNLVLFGARLKGVLHVNLVRNILKCIEPDRHTRQERHAAHIRLNRVLNLSDLAIEHVGVHLTPQVAARPASNHIEHVNGPPGELLDRLHQPARIVGDALKDRAHHLGARRVKAHIKEPAPNRVVLHRRALPK